MGRFILKRKIYSNDKQSVWNSQAWDRSNGDERATKMIINGKKGLYGVDPDTTKLWDTDKFVKEVHGYDNKRGELKGKIGKAYGDKGEIHTGLKYSKWNPWNTDVSINNYFNAAKNGKSGRDSYIHGETRGKSAKEIYKDYLEMLKYKGVVDDSGYMSNKEMKDALRQLEKRRKILKGAYIGGGTAAVAGIGYGANKLYNKRKE